MSAASVTAFPRRVPPTILILDEDVLTRCRISDALRTLGFKVLETSAAQDAVTVLDTTRVDLLFADIDVSGPQSGLDIARHACSRDMPVQILLTSAKSEASAIPDLNQLGLFIRKPYLTGQVVDLVSRSLNWPDAPGG